MLPAFTQVVFMRFDYKVSYLFTVLRDPAPLRLVKVRGTHPWVGQAEHLACRERPPNAFCGRGPHPLLPRSPPACSSAGQLSRRVPLSRSCRPCVPVSGLGWGHHLLMVFRRRWTVYGAAADGKGNRGDPAPLSVVSSAEKERLQEAPFRALWGRSIFVLG